MKCLRCGYTLISHKNKKLKQIAKELKQVWGINSGQDVYVCPHCETAHIEHKKGL